MKHHNVLMSVEIVLSEDEYALMQSGRISEKSVLREALTNGRWVNVTNPQVVNTHDDQIPAPCPKCGGQCGYWNLPLGCGK